MRIFYSFFDLIDPARIVDKRLKAVELRMDSPWTAAAKFQGQKVYLGKGVYADPTLYYYKGWKSCDWSFPDFKSGRYDEFLAGVRRSYKNKMRNV